MVASMAIEEHELRPGALARTFRIEQRLEHFAHGNRLPDRPGTQGAWHLLAAFPVVVIDDEMRRLNLCEEIELEALAWMACAEQAMIDETLARSEMTREAELGLGGFQDRRVVGAVGGMTGRAAFAPGMGVALVQLERGTVVAIQTQCRFVLGQTQRPDQAVGLVARHAIAVGHGRVDVPDVLDDILVTFDAGLRLLVETAAF